MSEAQAVGRRSIRVVPVVLASKAMGVALVVTVAALFGLGPATDAWYWAAAVPTMMMVLAGTSAATALTPTLATIEGQQRQQTVESAATWVVLVALVALIPVAMLGNGLVGALTHFDPQRQQLAARFLWASVPLAALVGLAAVLRATLEVEARYLAVAAAPGVRNAGSIVGLVVFTPVLGPFALPLALTIGELVHVGTLALALRRAGIRLRPRWSIPAPLRRALRVFAVLLAGEALVAMNVAVDKAFAGRLEAGAVATLEFADRVRVVPQSLLEATLVMVAFSTWSRLMAADQRGQAYRQIRQSLGWTTALALPTILAMYLLRFPIITALLERGAFSGGDTQAVAHAFVWYLPGILPTLWGILAVKAHVVLGNHRLIVVLGVTSATLNLTMNALLMPAMGVAGLALSTTITAGVVATAYLVALKPIWRRG